MRTVTSGITTALTAQGSFLGWLAEITTSAGTVFRLCSMDVDFPFGGFTFRASDLSVSGMAWDGGVARPASLTLGDADLTWGALVLNLALADAGLRLWQAYASATTEAQPLWSGRIGQCKRVGLSVQATLSNGTDTTFAPRTRVQQLVNPAFLLPAGTGLSVNGTRWVIERQ